MSPMIVSPENESLRERDCVYTPVSQILFVVLAGAGAHAPPCANDDDAGVWARALRAVAAQDLAERRGPGWGLVASQCSFCCSRPLQG
jgi:hypothetical protein